MTPVLIFAGEKPVTALAFTPDATRLVVVRTSFWPLVVWPLEIWTIATGECRQVPTPETESAPSLAIHPSGQLAFFAQGLPLSVVSLADGAIQEIPDSDAERVIVSPDGDWLVVAGFVRDEGRRFFGYRRDPSTKTICTAAWNVESQTPREQLAGFIGNGEQFVTIGSWRITVRDTETGAVRTAMRFTSDNPIHPVVSPDRSRLAVRTTTQLYIWDTATWKKQVQIPLEGRPYHAYAFHPTRPIVAAIQNGQTLVKFLDGNSLEVVGKFQWKLGEMKSVCFSADGTLAAAGAFSGKFVVWDVD